MNITKEYLKTLTNEELETLLAITKEVITNRSKSVELVLYTHDCKNSAKHHKGKYKHWAKLVTGVDTTKTNGYAFQGEFLSIEAEHKIPVGSIIAEVCGNNITIYEIESDGNIKCLLEAKTSSMSKLIDALAEKFI